MRAGYGKGMRRFGAWESEPALTNSPNRCVSATYAAICSGEWVG